MDDHHDGLTANLRHLNNTRADDFDLYDDKYDYDYYNKDDTPSASL